MPKVLPKKTKSSNTLRKGSLFTEKANNFIKDRVPKLQNIHKNVYAKIEKEMKGIPELSRLALSARQIRQRWTNVLDPRLCHEPLNRKEKAFIIEQVENKASASISWTKLSSEMESQLGRLRSENVLKNFWYRKKRQSNAGPPPPPSSPSSPGGPPPPPSSPSSPGGPPPPPSNKNWLNTVLAPSSSGGPPPPYSNKSWLNVVLAPSSSEGPPPSSGLDILAGEASSSSGGPPALVMLAEEAVKRIINKIN